MSTDRDWHSYNEALVRRGELNLDSSVVEEWSRELKKANEGKVGEPYLYPESYIRFLAFVRLLFHQPYRQTEGFVKSLSRFVDGLKAPDYSTIDRRTNHLQVDLDDSLVRSNDPVSIAVDASGVKVHNGGDWIRHVWKVKKGYLKIHFAVDVKTGQVVSMDVSSEKVGDGRRLKRLVRRAEESVRVRRVLADGAYDSKANFNFLAGEGIKPVIRVAKNSVPKCNGSYARKKAVIEQQAFRPKAWSRIHRFGYRWRAEGAFSCIKRIFGEYVTAKKFVNMAREMAMKASIYNGFIATA
ncbi:MAG: IS5 family transposase [Nitrososphaerota archaeon]|nr:IS5 family transposase [Nitrososphaerota archaeon]